MATLGIRAIEVNPIAMNVTAFFAVQEPVFAFQFSLAGLLFGMHVPQTLPLRAHC